MDQLFIKEGQDRHSAHRGTCSQDRLLVRLANVIFLICLALVARSKVDDATIGKAVLLDVVLHDIIVLMGIDSDVCIMGKAEVHDVTKDTMNIRIAGNTMNDMVGQGVV